MATFSRLAGEGWRQGDDSTTQGRVGTDNWWQVNSSGATNYSLLGNVGTYTVSGQAASIFKTKVIAADFGSYSITGQNATITYNTGGVNYSLVADKGDYTYTGQSASLLRSKVILANNGTYTLSGQNATLAVID